MLVKIRPFFTLLLSLALVACAATNPSSVETASFTKNLNDNTPISTMSAPGIERSIVPVVGNIYRFFNNHHSSLFLVTDEGVLFIDPLNVAGAEWVNAEINRLFDKQITHVLYSHGHEDHASGAAMFGDVEIISHVNTLTVIKPEQDHEFSRSYVNYDQNQDGLIDQSEASGDLLTEFEVIDIDNDGVLKGYETETYFYRNVVPPTQTYSSQVHTVELGGETVEMHFVGGNHAADMSYIVFPEESLIFYVDIISLRAIPFGPLAWYSKEDSDNTYAVALAIEADIVVPSHGPIGTQDDVSDLQRYMAELREQVSEKIDQGHSLEEIQMSIDMQDYAGFDFFEERLPQNVQGMYRVLMEEKAG